MGTVYLDIYIIKNICIDYFLLYMVGSAMQIEKKQSRLLGASVIGAAGAAVPVLLMWKYGSVSSVAVLTLWYLVGLCMVKAAFSMKLSVQMWYAFMILVIFACLLNGILTWLEQQGIESEPVIFFLSFFILSSICRWISGICLKKERIYPVTVYLGNTCVQGMALLDTGNELRDPLTGLPVMIGEFGTFSGFLPIDYKKLFEEFYKRGTPDYQTIAAREWRDIRWIPYETIGHETELMIGIICNKVQIYTKRKTSDCGKAVLALVDQKFSGESEYTMILQNNMLH